jgi:tRNA-(ms[2]io[6]A)-hydroxylase
MKLSLDLTQASSEEWLDSVMADFNSFLQDHANCERKASAMAMSFVAKYPDRLEIIPELIETAIEELDHFKSVYQIMQCRMIKLPHAIGQDNYVKQLLEYCKSGRIERFMDRLLLGSVIECRGAERFQLIYKRLEDKELRNFYRDLWASEAKHGNVFVKMALNYFDKNVVYDRLEELNNIEGMVLNSLPIKPALH